MTQITYRPWIYLQGQVCISVASLYVVDRGGIEIRLSVDSSPPDEESVRGEEVPRSRSCARHFHHFVMVAVSCTSLPDSEHEYPFLFPQGNTPSDLAGHRPTVAVDDLKVLIKLLDACGLERDPSDDGALWKGVEVEDDRVVALRFSVSNLRGETSIFLPGSVLSLSLLPSPRGSRRSLSYAGLVCQRYVSSLVSLKVNKG